MSFTLHGIAVSSGIAIGHAHLISHTSLEVAHYVLPKQFIAEEIARFDAALLATRNEFASLRSNIAMLNGRLKSRPKLWLRSSTSLKMRICGSGRPM
jgi:phosphoenolpyruvate-protein kinase (PTS system EI component)